MPVNPSSAGFVADPGGTSEFPVAGIYWERVYKRSDEVAGADFPSRGDRVEQTRHGSRRTGTVWYSDQLQLLVKWDDGRSSSIRRDEARDLRSLRERPAP